MVGGDLSEIMENEVRGVITKVQIQKSIEHRNTAKSKFNNIRDYLGR